MHRITNADEETKIGFCEECGDNTPLWRQGKQRWRCAIKAKEEYRKWRKNNPESGSRSTAWRRNHPEQTSRIQFEHRERVLKHRYGLPVGWYAKILAEQNGGCAICGRKPSDHRRLALDHDHETNKPRGLLCDLCNTRLWALESQEWKEKAEKYLSESKSFDYSNKTN